MKGRMESGREIRKKGDKWRKNREGKEVKLESRKEIRKRGKKGGWKVEDKLRK